MDNETGKILSKILGKRDLDKIPPDIAKKVEQYFDQRFEDFLTTKALYDNSRRNIEKLQSDYDNLNAKSADSDAKIDIAQQNTNELRGQLEQTKLQIIKLTEIHQRLELDIGTYRKERNEAFDDRDQQIRIVERQNTTIEHLQAEITMLTGQLQSAIATKIEAITRCDDIDDREHRIDRREKSLEKDREMMQQQIDCLTNNLSKTSEELQSIRSQNTMGRLQLENDLRIKTEELRLSNSLIEQYKETNQQLFKQSDELNLKLKEHTIESEKMMKSYQEELMAKTKLADLYKQGSDEDSSEKLELKSLNAELRKRLNEITDEFGELETRLRNIDVTHEKEIETRETQLQSLRDELKHANDLLKMSNDENVENMLERLTPTAAAASRRLKSSMTLTQIYSLYVQTSQDLQLKERECTETSIQLKSILQELEEKAPEWKRQQIEYQNVVATNEELQHQLDKLINEQVDLRERLNDTTAKFGHIERENKKLKSNQTDLSRQVCYLLVEIEQMRRGVSQDQEPTNLSDMSGNEVISKKLVTFNDVSELHENNQKLLLLVRDLSDKLEELEEIQSNINEASYETKIEQYKKRVEQLELGQEQQEQLLQSCINQKDRFKRLYFEIMADVGKIPPLNLDNSNSKQDMMDGIVNNDEGGGGGGDDDNNDEDVDQTNRSVTQNSTSTPSAGGINHKKRLRLSNSFNKTNISVGSTPNNKVNPAVAKESKKIADLEKQIQDNQKQLNNLKDEYDEYRREKTNNDKLVHEQFDSMRSEVRELTSSNCKLMVSTNFQTEQIKTQQKNVAIYKKQIETLEERNRLYDKTIAKHEQTISYLRDQMMSSHQRSSAAELKCEELQRQCRRFLEEISQLKIERDALYRERHGQQLLQNNMELIKTAFERSENEGRIRMEQRLDEAVRECSGLRRRLQEEQDHFRELSADLQRKTDTAVGKMTDEQQQVEKLNKQMQQLRDEIINKTQQIDDLSQKLQESLTPCKSDNPIAKANKKIKELQMNLDKRTAEVKQLESDCNAANVKLEQLTKISSEWEAESQQLHDSFEEYKTKMATDLSASQLSETNLKSRIEELQTEIKLQITGAQINTTDTTSQLNKTQNELKDTMQKMSEMHRELRELRTECQKLKSNLLNLEQKYANEMMLHSSDVQALTLCKDELNKVKEIVDQIRLDRDQAVEALKTQLNEWETVQGNLGGEKQELETRLTNLDAQNIALHEQLQLLSNKLQSAHGGNDISMNDSTVSGTDAGDNSLVSRSITEDDYRNTSIEQLMTIIKYLRKEKDIAVTRVDVYKSENVRLQTETDLLKKSLNEALTASTTADRPSSETNFVTATKYEDLLRKLETLNAITDSNRLLRDERDGLSAREKSLNERVSKLEDELFPLQEKNREQQTKIEEQQVENISLRRTAEQWHKRANALVERNNKNPEDFKRLLGERENLAKMLSAEKEVLRVVNEELQSIKTEKARLDIEFAQIVKQCQLHVDDKKKLSDELQAVKQQNNRNAQDIMELKNTVLQKEDELKKLTDEMTEKEALLTDIRNKEVQIRRIAKRYKDSYFELKTKVDEQDADMASKPIAEQANAAAEQSAAAAAREENQRAQVARLAEFTAQIATQQEEIEQLRRDNSSLAEARNRIKQLTETNDQMSREYQQSKSQLQSCEQNRSEHDLLVAGLKSQCDGRIKRMEKELQDQDAQLKETIARLTRENETLNLRVNQLHRQLQQQGSKPSTSSGPAEKSPSDPARTANVKPMAGPSGQQSATVNPRRGGDTPLASIRPMSVQNSRTAAVLPTSQTSSSSNVAAVQGSSSSGAGSSSGSVTVLVPPQQQVHTTGHSSSSSAEAISSSPTSSHTDYMPATSSAVVVAAIPPMGSSSASTSSSSSSSSTTSSSTSTTVAAATAAAAAAASAASASIAESSQEAESVPTIGNTNESSNLASPSSQIIGQQQQPQQQQQQLQQQPPQQLQQQQQQPQVVALVSPRVEVSPQNIIVPPQQSPHQVSEQNQAPSTSGGIGGSSSSSSSTTSSSIGNVGGSGSSNLLATGGGSSAVGSGIATAMSTHHMASSSNTVTTTQAASGGSGSGSGGGGGGGSGSGGTTSSTSSHKRPREGEGDSSTGIVDDSSSISSENKMSPKNKRTRMMMGGDQQTFQGVSESGLDVEYQVPTSSQRDQDEDNVIVVDSEDDDEDDGMADEGTAEQFEDDNGESYEMEESYDQEQDDEGDGPDIDEDQVQQGHGNNEVEVDDSSEAPNQSSATGSSVVASGSGISGIIGVGAASTISAVAASSDVGTSVEQSIDQSPQNQQETQQIQMISSGSEARSSTWHSESHRQSTSTQSLIIQQAFEETGDDSIVPSTPTLYAVRRTDGFSEAVSSPHPQVPQQHGARFTFNESGSSSSSSLLRSGMIPTAGPSTGSMEAMMDDTRIDLSQLDESGGSGGGQQQQSQQQQISPSLSSQQQPSGLSSPSSISLNVEPNSGSSSIGGTGNDNNQPEASSGSGSGSGAEVVINEILTSTAPEHSSTTTTTSSSSSLADTESSIVATTSHQANNEPKEAIAGPSGINNSENIPQIIISDNTVDNDGIDNATTSDTANESKDSNMEDNDIEEEIGTVTSEGEKTPSDRAAQVEEGREAEATIQAPSSNTRSRSNTPRQRGRGTRGRGNSTERPTPIVWQGQEGSPQLLQQHQQQQLQQQQFINHPASPNRGASSGSFQRTRGRRMKRAAYNNPRY